MANEIDLDRSIVVAVVILNWNGASDTIECIDSVLAQSHKALKIYICDNGSTDGSIDIIRRHLLFKNNMSTEDVGDIIKGAQGFQEKVVNIEFVENHENIGFAAGNNAGIRVALLDPTCQFLWIINNDTIVSQSALAAALQRMNDDPKIGICGSTVVYAGGRNVVQAFGGAIYKKWKGASSHIGAFASVSSIPSNPSEIEISLDYVLGAAMLVRREFIEAVGLMSEDYFLYYEEIDWATRGAGRFRLGYAPGSIVWHKEGASIGTAASGGSPLSMYYLYRSRLRFTAKHHPWCLPTVTFWCGVDVLKLLLRRRWPQALAAMQGVAQWPRKGMPHLALKNR